MANPQAESKKKSPVAEGDRIIAIGDAAKALGVSEETLRRWIRQRKVAYTLVGPFRVKKMTQAQVDALRETVAAAKRAKAAQDDGAAHDA